MLLLSVLLPQLCLITLVTAGSSKNNNNDDTDKHNCNNKKLNNSNNIVIIEQQQQLLAATVDAAVFLIVVVVVVVVALLTTYNHSNNNNNNSNNNNNNSNNNENKISHQSNNKVTRNTFIWTRKRRKDQNKKSIKTEINATTTSSATTKIATTRTTSKTTVTNIFISCWMPSPAADKPEQHQHRQQQHQQQQKLQQQQYEQRQTNRPRQDIFNGFPLAFSTLLAALSILNSTATLQTMAFTTSMATAAGYNEAQQQHHQQQQQQQQPPQPQHQEQEQHQSNLLAVIENSLESSNHTLKSFSHINAVAYTSAETDVEEMETQPVFDFGLPRNLTARTGQAEAAIKCRVAQLNDKSVSWIRKRDLHILTVATSTYTSDKRFEVTASKDQREWTLHVKSPQLRDSGIYECQVNTEPKMSMAFQLNIIVTPPDARAVISGPADLHFKVGSVIILNCIVEQPSFKDIGPIYWYRGEQMLTPFRSELDEIDVDAKSAPSADDAAADGAAAVDDVSQNAVADEQVITNDIENDFAARIAMESQLGDTLKSRLRISNAQTTDTGNYSCQPTTASSASVMIHVINDENPAAMQKSEAPPSLFTATFAADAAPLQRILYNVAAPWLLYLLMMGGFDELVMLYALREAIYFLFTSSIISR